MLDNLKKYQILLASKSPRRRELLEQLRINFTIISLSGIEETYPADLPVTEVPLYLARLKADAYRKLIHGNEMIITADTVVIDNGKVLGKPKDHKEAARMLRELSGHSHEVATGVTVSTIDRSEAFVTRTEVKFAELTDQEIEYYIESFNPYDKAGAYGIQEWIGCVAVEYIKGSFYNVMGLPVQRLYEVLKSF